VCACARACAGVTKWVKTWKANGWRLKSGGQVTNKEDFEKLEQLCRISGDEEDLLGNLELLESLKKTPEQKDTCCAEDSLNEETKSHVPTQEHDSEKAAVESAALVDQEGLAKLTSQGEGCDAQSQAGLSSGPPPEVKEQGSLSKMPTKNGLMMQVRREHCR